MDGKETKNREFYEVPMSYTVTLGEIVTLIQSFKESRIRLTVPNIGNALEKTLYSTYLSYLLKTNLAIH